MLPGSLQGNAQAGVKIYGITAVYNEAPTLGAVMESIFDWHSKGRYGQNLLKWFFVDDGSDKDDSLRIISDYAQKYPFIECISLAENQGKAMAYKKAAEWIIENDAKAEERVIFQMDSDLIGVNRGDIDGLICSLMGNISVGSYSGTRLACLALVPSPHQNGLRKKCREYISHVFARDGLAITGQRAYFGSAMVDVIEHIDEETGYGLEALLNAMIIDQFKNLKKKFKIREVQKSELIGVVMWDHITHLSHKQKLRFSLAPYFKKLDFLRKPAAAVLSVGHYFKLGTETFMGFVKGTTSRLLKRGEKRERKRG